MKQSEFPEDFVKTLLAQDGQMTAQGFDEQRQIILKRLIVAELKERRGRKVVLTTFGGCLAILLILASAGVMHRTSSGSEWPEWLAISLALVVILFPLAALLILGIYLFRHKRELSGVRKEAYEQTLLTLPKQINAIRIELDTLRQHLKAPPGNQNDEKTLRAPPPIVKPEAGSM